jgi:hypothetical protein
LTSLALLSQNKVNEGIADFRTEIMYCVKAGLSRYGVDLSELVLSNLKWITGLRQEDIPWKPDDLGLALDRVFGYGSDHIKDAIIEEIRQKFGISEACKSLKQAFDVVLLRTA